MPTNPCEHLLKKRVVSKFSVNHSRANKKVCARIHATAPPARHIYTCPFFSRYGLSSCGAFLHAQTGYELLLAFPSLRCRGVHRPRHESNGPEFAREETPHANALFFPLFRSPRRRPPQSDDSSAVLYRLFFAWSARLPFQQRVGNPLAARNPKE